MAQHLSGAIRVHDEVMEVLVAAQCDGLNLQLVGQLSRPLYEKVNKVLEAIGGKWNRKAKAHVFDGDASEIVGDVVSSGMYTDSKTAFQFYETPDEVADLLLDGVVFNDVTQILEPSAGRGALIRAAVRHGAHAAFISAVELDAKHELALNKMGVAVRVDDFLALQPQDDNRVDAVVMNPPFAKSQDIDHVRHAHKFLRDGGMLYAVMSSGWTFRSDKKATAFRSWLDELGGSWEPLDAGAFQESGTMVNAVLVRIAR